MNNMRVLITGIGGFIGQNVAEYLKENGMEIIGIYHNNRPNSAVKKVFSCDLSKEDIEKYVNDEMIDAIIHFAGQMRGNKIRDYLDNTIGSTRRLINYAEKRKIRTFIYISSISVYGETISSVNENSDRINLDDYGMTKYLCERMLEDADIERRIVIRLPRMLGKGCDLSYPWIPKVTGQMLKNEDIYYMNPDLMYNNMLYVDDLSEFLIYLLRENKNGFDCFVLGATGRMRIFDILNKLKECLDSHSVLVEKPVSGRNKCYAIDIRHAEEHGFVSRQIDDIIEKFAEDMKASMEEV